MKKITLIQSILPLLVLFPQVLAAQMSFENCLEKLELEESEVVFTDESVMFYPRGFIYDLSNSDSLTYFGCIGTNQRDFVKYFEINSETMKFSVATDLDRKAGEHVESIKLETIQQKLDHFFYADTTKTVELNHSTRYVMICYWNSKTLIEEMIENFSFFKKYANEHPELKIQVLFVSTDKA